MALLRVVAASLSFLVVNGLGQELLSECPNADGFFADAVQCDKYYHCLDGLMTEKLCPDGMVFNDLNSKVEVCDFPFQVSCDERPELQTAQGRGNCPRLNGYFAHPEKGNCNQFFYCSEGVGSLITCPEGLVFSLKTGTCVWPDEAGRVGCDSENILNFTCPKVPIGVAIAHPRYADPLDCQYFYVCINGEVPRRNGCAFGQVFNTETGACDEPRKVPECADYYRDFFEEYFATLSSSKNRPTADIVAAAIASGFEVPNVRTRIRVDPAKTRRRRPVQVREEAPLQQEEPRTTEPTGPPEEVVEQAPAKLRRPGAPVRRRLTRRGQGTSTTSTTPPPSYDYPNVYDDYPEVPLFAP